jgi:hypothetical protein
MSSLSNNYSAIAEQEHEVTESAVTLVSAGSITVAMTTRSVHNFAGVVFYNDASGDTPLDPSGLTGTTDVSVKTTVQPHGFQVAVNPTLNAAIFDQANWAANTTEVKGEFTSITGATHAKLIVTSNKT